MCCLGNGCTITLLHYYILILSHDLHIQTLQGACLRRLNGADFTPCDFLPADRSDDFCCPLEQEEGILAPVAMLFQTDYIACGIANRSMYKERSTNWTDDECLIMKALIEDQAYQVGTCVCPGSDKLNTSAPPSEYPTSPTAPSAPALVNTSAPSAPPVRPFLAPTAAPTSGASLMSMGATALGFLGFFF